MAETPDLTLAEVAGLRRFTRRYLRELIRRHQIQVLRSGRLIRFDALALCALEEALRWRSPSPAAGQLAPSPSRALSPASAFAAALKATTPSSRPERQPHSKPKSSAPRRTASGVELAPSQRR